MDTTSPKVESRKPNPIPVFNRTNGVLGFSFPEFPLLEIPPGTWVTHYPPPPFASVKAQQPPIDPLMVTQYLQHDPALSTQIRNRQFGYQDKHNLTIAASYDPVTGWGRTSAHITDELAKLRQKESPEKLSFTMGEGTVSFRGGSKAKRAWSVDDFASSDNTDLMLFPITRWHRDAMPDNVIALMDKPHHPTRWALAMTIPPEIQHIPSQNIVLLTMWETSHIPDDWIPHLRRVKHLIVPSAHQVELFRPHFKGDISVVPLGVDPDVFSYRPRPTRAEGEPFTIVCYGNPLTSRKSPLEIVQEVCWQAFYGAGGEPIDDWKLILKTTGGVLGAGKFGMTVNDPHVEVVSGQYTNEELADMLYRADLGVFLSKFEGFGLCPLEAMSTGLPVILSDNTGHKDFCHPSYNYPIPTRRIIPAQEAYSGQEEWKWEEPDFEMAARELRNQYFMWKWRGRTQSPVGAQAAAYVRQHFTWRKTAESINDILNTLTKT